MGFALTACRAEEMLQTEHLRGGRFEASCDEYHLPNGLKEHVDFVKPGIVASDVTGRNKRSRDYIDDGECVLGYLYTVSRARMPASASLYSL